MPSTKATEGLTKLASGAEAEPAANASEPVPTFVLLDEAGVEAGVEAGDAAGVEVEDETTATLPALTDDTEETEETDTTGTTGTADIANCATDSCFVVVAATVANGFPSGPTVTVS